MPLDLEKVIGFQWDAGNETKSVDRHSVSRREAEEAFADQRLRLVEDAAHSKSELRYHAFGETKEGRLLQVSFTIRGNLIRVISARSMNRRERKMYESQN